VTLDRRQLRAVTWFYVFGMLSQGGLTLLARLVPAVDRALPAILEETQMIVPHSLLHIATGLLAVGMLLRGGPDGAWRFLAGFGLFYTALGLLGPLTGLQFGLGLQHFDHPIHLVLGGAALAAAWLGRGSRAAGGSRP